MVTAEDRNVVTISLSTVVLRVAELQEALSASKEARCSLERRCESLLGQVDNARSDADSYKNQWNALLKHTKEKEGQLHGKVVPTVARQGTIDESCIAVAMHTCETLARSERCIHGFGTGHAPDFKGILLDVRSYNMLRRRGIVPLEPLTGSTLNC